jgi:hypothetical protein
MPGRKRIVFSLVTLAIVALTNASALRAATPPAAATPPSFLPSAGVLHVTFATTPEAAVAGGGGTYVVVVANTGSTPLSDIKLYSLECEPFSPMQGDANGNGKLDPNEQWQSSCSAAYPSQAGSWLVAVDAGALDSNGELEQAWVHSEAQVTAADSVGPSPLMVAIALGLVVVFGILLLVFRVRHRDGRLPLR